MKDIYSLLNEMDIDENEFEAMEVSELDKARVKRTLRDSIKQKKKRHVWKIAVAVIAISCSFTTLELTSPAYAGRIPVIGDIFRFIDNGRTGLLYDEYKNYSSVINTTKENNGIKVTINEAIYDGDTVSIAYSIESDRDLGNNPYIKRFLDVKGSIGLGGGNQISKVNKNNYVGLITATPSFNSKGKDTLNVKWNLESITIQENKEEITGDWKFSFSLNALESHTQLIDRNAEQDGVSVHIGKLSITPMSFVVFYDQVVNKKVRNNWDGVDIDIEIKDDLGNRYSGKGNGGSGDRDGYNMNWSKTFEKLAPNATKLIITPKIRLYEHTSDNHGSVEITRQGVGAKENPFIQKSSKGEEKTTLEDIIIELKK